MNLDDQLRAVLNEEADVRDAPPPDVRGMISGGQARRRRRNAAWAGGSILAAVIAVAGSYGVAQQWDVDTSSEDHGVVDQGPGPQAVPITHDGATAIDAGTHLVPAGESQVAAYDVTVPGGWHVQYGIMLVKHPAPPAPEAHPEIRGVEGMFLSPFVLDEVRLFRDACHGGEKIGAAPSSVTELVSGLRAQQSGPVTSDPVATTIGGLPATRIDLGFRAGADLSDCRIPGMLQIWRADPERNEDYNVLLPNGSISVYVVEVAGRTQGFLAQTLSETSDTDRAELQSILDSISFDTGAP